MIFHIVLPDFGRWIQRSPGPPSDTWDPKRREGASDADTRHEAFAIGLGCESLGYQFKDAPEW